MPGWGLGEEGTTPLQFTWVSASVKRLNFWFLLSIYWLLLRCNLHATKRCFVSLPQPPVWYWLVGWLVAFFFHYETHADLTHALPASVFKHYDTREIPILTCADTEGLFVHPELAPLTYTVISVFSSSCIPGRVSRCQVLLLLLHSLPHFSEEITSATLPLDLPRWDNLSSSAFRLLHLHPTCSDLMFSSLVTSLFIIILFRSGISFGAFFKRTKPMPFYFPYLKYSSTEPLVQ